MRRLHGRPHHGPLHPPNYHHLPPLCLDDRQAGPGEKKKPSFVHIESESPSKT